MSHTCVLCGSKTTSFKHPRFQMLFHECPVCLLITKDESIHISESEEISIYLRHENSLDNHGYVNYLMNYIEQGVLPYIKEGNVLDFGSGPEPVLSHLLKSLGFQVDLYDYYFAPEKIYEDKQYDLITSTEVIEHIKNPVEAFHLFHKHLKPNGILSLMTLFYPKDKNTFFDWFYIRDHSHITFFAPETMLYIAKKTGFELLDHNAHRITVLKCLKT